MTEKTKEKINEVKSKLAEFKPIMDGLSRARNPFELRYFVIGKHDDRIQQYKQAVVEMDAKYRAIEESHAELQLTALKREALQLEINPDPRNRFEEMANEKLQIEIARTYREDHQRRLSMTGAFKEVMDFITIIENEYSDLMDMTEEELLRYEVEYWQSRLSKQIQIDLMTLTKISPGNLSVLLSMPKDVQERILAESLLRTEEHKLFQNRVANETMVKFVDSNPKKTQFIAPPDYIPLKKRKDAPEGYPTNKIVDIDVCEIMTATLHRPGDTAWLTNEFWIPAGKNYVKHYMTCEKPDMIGECRNRIVKDALSLGCEYLFFVDDDLVVDPGALMKLYQHKKDVVGFWYPKKVPIVESATIIRDGESKMGVPVDSKGLIEIDWTLTAGGTLYNMDVFRKLPYPWFLTTEHGTEDTYFCARAREAGIKIYLDCDIKAKHVDKGTGIIYSFDGAKQLEAVALPTGAKGWKL